MDKTRDTQDNKAFSTEGGKKAGGDFFTRNKGGAPDKAAVVAGAAPNHWPPRVRRPKSEVISGVVAGQTNSPRTDCRSKRQKEQAFNNAIVQVL